MISRLPEWAGSGGVRMVIMYPRMKKILVTRGIFPEVIEALSKRFDVVHNAEDRPWPPEELAARLAGVSGAMATVMDKFDEPLLVRCPELKVISNIAVGVQQHRRTRLHQARHSRDQYSGRAR